MKILVVDDSGFKRKSLKYILEKDGYEVLEAENGKEGIEKAMMQKPDAIVSDILMPIMDGFQFIHKLNKNKDLNSIPLKISKLPAREWDLRKSQMLFSTISPASCPNVSLKL